MDYVIVTPAYNEEKCIERTIAGVLRQTHKPLMWIVVDDGSSDGTADIVKRYTGEYDWIRYVFRRKEEHQSYYASSVFAIQKGLEQMHDIRWDFIAILDADIYLPADYYRTMSDILSSDQRIGIASGNCADKIGNRLKMHLYDRRSCAKAIMVVRKECFEELGGLLPLKYGGEDTYACFSARKNEWKTWAYHELIVEHNKPLGMGPSSSIVKVRFRQGVGEYYLGFHPLFVMLKSVRRCVLEKPFGIGGLIRMLGFACAHFYNEKRQISDETVRYIRKEQIARILGGNRIPEAQKVRIAGTEA